MRFITTLFNTLLLTILLVCQSDAAENAFYVLRSNSPAQIGTIKDAYASLMKNYQSINLLISQAYQVDQNGIVWGYVGADVEKFAKEHHMKLMILVTNAGFDKEKTHQFLTHPLAEQTALQSILEVCEKNHYNGVQFDFEMIALNDRDGLTQFYQKAADMLHKKGFSVSFAVAPVVGTNPQPSEFLKKLYTTWEGAYDLKALAQSADFLTIMAYNQHGEGTTPGPTAGADWVEETIKYALQFIPANKISLGIASYSDYWYTGSASGSAGRISVHMSDMGYSDATYLLQKYQAQLRWDDKAKVHYAIFPHNWLYEYIFVEDAPSFQPKLDLVKKYHLRGISVFYLGIEDPKIWDLLKA